MTKKEIDMMVKLREFVREQFNSLDGKTSPLAQMKVQDGAWILSSIVNSIDDVLKGHVEFK
jgi:hypothetical protein